MSRAMVIRESQADVLAMCDRRKARISVIETLPEGYTRLVLCAADDAAAISRAFKGSIVEGTVKRIPLSLATRGVPYVETPPAAPVTQVGSGLAYGAANRKYRI